MDCARSGSHPGETLLDEHIAEYLESLESGNYRRNVESTLDSWAEWVQTERNRQQTTAVSVLDCRHYARHLKQRTRADELKASTARTYYAIVRAFLGFCVDEEVLESNPAAVRRAVDELPEEVRDANRQFWGTEDRNRLFEYVDDRANAALEGNTETDRMTAFRDRALVYLLAMSGVRAGEVFSDPADEKRNGTRWSDLDLENGTVRVFGKSREYEYAQIPERAAAVLERYRAVLEPPAETWPVFPSRHSPSLYAAVRTQLSEQGIPSEEVETLLEDDDVESVIREYGVTPPALSKNGARSIVETLCEAADITVDGEPLKLHGARRGLGHELYREGHAELAQSALRHSSIEVTHAAYSDIQASDTAERVSEILDAE